MKILQGIHRIVTMHPYRYLSIYIILFLSCYSTMTYAGYGKHVPSKIRLVDVQTLTFGRDEYTTARRSSPIPQMKCSGDNCQYAPSSAMCKNIGLDGHDVVWQCEAPLPRGVKFGKVTVSCESYAHPDDEYVLYGSCGLKYTLEGHPVYPEDIIEKPSLLSRTLASLGEYSHTFWPLSFLGFGARTFSNMWSIVAFFLP
jgi:hypothetical protein